MSVSQKQTVEIVKMLVRGANVLILDEPTSGLDPVSRDELTELLRRSHVLIVCGDEVDEAVKNDIAVAQRLGITATTLDGILKIRSQGHEEAR